MTMMYDLCQEFSIIQHDGRLVTDYFAVFKRYIKNLMPIIADVKKLHEQKEELAVWPF